MKTEMLPAFVVAMVLSCSAFAAEIAPAPVVLWPAGAPGATGDSPEDKPAIYAYLPDPAKATGAAMLVMPGGGFQTRVIDQEGVLVAQWLKARGIAAFVLRYRIRPIGNMSESIADAQRAMRFLRAHAAEYKISPNRIGTIGFSAGAELCVAAAFTPASPAPDATDPIDRLSSQSNFMVLAYGSANTPIPEPATNLPPTFMFCTAEDSGHLNPMLTLYTNLRRARVPAEVHFFVNGGHGVGLAQGDPVLGAWPELAFNWISAGGFLTEKPRVALKGLVKLDGEPLPRGVVIFTPIDQPGAPTVAAYVFNTGPVRGEFDVPAGQGPVAGRYKVEVHQYAMRWMSNSQEPFIVGINQRMRGGLSEQDRQDWLKFARARDLEPTIEDERVFAKKHPGDREPIIVEIKATGESPIDIEVFSK